MSAPDFHSISVRSDTQTGKTYNEAEVQAIVAAARAALQWLDDDLGVSSEAQPERQNLRSALSALEAGK
jgi:hypothetical protein